jgi:hypothetical protein
MNRPRPGYKQKRLVIRKSLESTLPLHNDVIQLLTTVLISHMVFADVRYTLRRRASKNGLPRQQRLTAGSLEIEARFLVSQAF